VVVVNAAQQQPVFVQHVPSYVGHIVFSCIVAWCCNPLFGLIAFILASQYNTIVIFFIATGAYLGGLATVPPLEMKQTFCIKI